MSVDMLNIRYCNIAVGGDTDGDDEWDRWIIQRTYYYSLTWLMPMTWDEIPGANYDKRDVLGKPYNLKIVVQDDGTLTTIVNDKEVIEIVMPGYGHGGIKFMCDTGATFDNFAVEPLP